MCGSTIRTANCSFPCIISRRSARKDIAIEDTFANESDALGDVTIEIQQKDEGVRLFVNGKEMRHENLKKVYYSDLVDANNCTYLAISALR